MGLFTFGSFDFPMKHIEYKGYDTAPDQRQDLDSYTDSYGVTQRNALSHTKTQVQIKTLPMSAAEMDEITSGLENNYISYNETDAQCTYYNPRKRTFSSGHMYLDPSVQFNVVESYPDGTPKKYGEMTWTFIEY